MGYFLHRYAGHPRRPNLCVSLLCGDTPHYAGSADFLDWDWWKPFSLYCWRASRMADGDSISLGSHISFLLLP